MDNRVLEDVVDVAEDVLPPFDAEHVPGLGLGEELGHGALR